MVDSAGLVTYCDTLVIIVVCYCCRFSIATSKWVQAVNCATCKAMIKRGHKMVKCKCELKQNIHKCDLTQQIAICHEIFIREIILKTIIDRERFAGLNIHGFSPIEVFMEILSHCLGHKCSLFSLIKERQLYSQKNFRGTPENCENTKVYPSKSFPIQLQYIELVIYMCFQNMNNCCDKQLKCT